MAHVAYSEQEMQAAIRIAYATAVRDILTGIDDPSMAAALSDEEIAHCTSLITDPSKLQGTVDAVKQIAASYAHTEPYKRRHRASK